MNNRLIGEKAAAVSADNAHDRQRRGAVTQLRDRVTEAPKTARLTRDDGSGTVITHKTGIALSTGTTEAGSAAKLFSKTCVSGLGTRDAKRKREFLKLDMRTS